MHNTRIQVNWTGAGWTVQNLTFSIEQVVNWTKDYWNTASWTSALFEQIVQLTMANWTNQPNWTIEQLQLNMHF